MYGCTRACIAHAAGDETTAVVAADVQTQTPGQWYVCQGCQDDGEQRLEPSRESSMTCTGSESVICHVTSIARRIGSHTVR